MSYYNYTYNNECHDAPTSITEAYYYVIHGHNFKTVLGDFLDYFYSRWAMADKESCQKAFSEPININDVDIDNNQQASILEGLADHLADDFCLEQPLWTQNKIFISKEKIFDVGDVTNTKPEIIKLLEDTGLTQFKKHNVIVGFDSLTRQGFYPMADKYNKPRMVRKALRKNKLDWYSVRKLQEQQQQKKNN